MVVKPVEPMLAEQGAAPSKLEPSAMEVQDRALEAEDARADINLLESSPIASPMHVKDVHVEPQETMA